MQIIMKRLEEIIPYEKNPRKNDDAVEYVMNSIKEFGFKVPIVIDKNNIIVAGHTRYKASKKLKLKEVPCIIADDLSEEQIKAYRVADNKVSEKAQWDYDLLDEELCDIKIDMSQFGFDINVKTYDDTATKNSLQERFIVPPFSVFDTKQGYWQERKRKWLSLGIKSEIGREENLLGYSEIAKLEGLSGTSIFDPVLCEICYKWFNIPKGKIFDSFAGGSVRGIVAEILGYSYTGIDLSKKQIEANEKNAVEIGVSPRWICDDSLNMDNYIENESVDLFFSCPPYADLEVYSKDEKDLSNMNYPDFLKAYREIIRLGCNKLKNDRFAIFVVSEVRDKKGIFYNFVGDTKQAFIDAGLKYYNEIILYNVIGSGAMRATKVFNGGRKVIRTHQNILIFYKGDIKKIKENYKMEDITEEELKELVKEEDNISI